MKMLILSVAALVGLTLGSITASATELRAKVTNTTGQSVSYNYSSCSGASCPAFPTPIANGATSPIFKMSSATGGPLQMIFRYGYNVGGTNQICQFYLWTAQWGGTPGNCATPNSYTSQNWGSPSCNIVGTPTINQTTCDYEVHFQIGN